MVLITNFGDVTTTGNMIVNNNFTVLGSFTSFASLLVGGAAPLSIGNAASPFSQVFASTLTSTTANVTSIYGTQGFVGVGTTNPGQAALFVQGNLFVSNAIQTTNLYATTINVTTMNALFIVNSSGSLGIGTTNPQGANLYVQGNVFASNALSTPNIFATSINTYSINTSTLIVSSNIGIGIAPGLANLYVFGNAIVTNALTTTNIFASNLTVLGNLYVGGFVSAQNVTATLANLTTVNAVSVVSSLNVGIGTAPGQANLYVQGNAFVSNALSTTNVFATSINVTTLNLTSLFTQSGLLGIGTASPSQTTLYVQGNIYASNALTTTNIYATTANVGFLNVVSLYVTTNIGIGSNPGNTNLYVQGNVFISNALQTTNVFAQTLNVTTLNTASIFGQFGFIGIGTTNPSQTTLYVAGNIYASNAVTATNIFATTLNVTTLNTASLFLSSNVGIGTTSAQGANLYVQGNVYVSNALSTTNVFVTGTLNATTINTFSFFASSNIGIGTGSAQGANLYVQGNVFVSNSLSVTNVYATSANVTTANLTSIYGSQGFVGINTSNPQGFPLWVQGNVYVSSNLTATNIIATSINTVSLNTLSLVATSNIGIGTASAQGANLYVQGNVYVSNALSTTNVFVTGTLNATTINTFSFFASSNIGIGTGSAQGANLYVQGNVFVSNALSATNIFVTGTLNSYSINSSSLVVSSNIGIGTAPGLANLYVLGNVFVSNAISTNNLFVTGTLNTFTVNTSTLIISSNLGIGTASTQGANLYVQGNVFVSNALSTTNLFVTGTLNAATINTSTFLISSNLGIGTASTQGANLYVQGNIFVSNALSTTNLFATTVNVATLNVTSVIFASNVGIGTASPQGANLYVQGNVYVSNALSTTNIFATTINVTTINTNSFLFSTVGIGANQGTTNLYVQGNVYVSGNLYSTNISSQTIYYGEDIFKRGPYLTPSAANGPAIQAWISAMSNASSQPTRSWWATSVAPSFGNVATSPATAFFGSLLLPDGRIFFVPTAGTSVGFFNPVTSLYTTSSVTFVATGLRGAVLVPNGNVVMIPWGTSSNVIVLNPLSLVSSNIITGVAVPNAFQGGVLSPTGNVIMCPVSAANIGLVNPTTMTYINVGPTSAPTSSFSGAVLMPNGNVFFGGAVGSNSAMYNTSCIATVSGATLLGGNFSNINTGKSSLQSVYLAPNGNIIGLPYTGSNIVSVNPITFTSSNIACGASLMGGAMLPSGNLICAPSSSSNVGMFDTVALTFSNVAGAVTSGVAGATLYPDGRVFFSPSSGNIGCLSTMVPADPAWCLGPYFNKF